MTDSPAVSSTVWLLSLPPQKVSVLVRFSLLVDAISVVDHAIWFPILATR